MTKAELAEIEAEARGECGMCLRLVSEVRRLTVEVDELHDDRLRVMAERDALRAALADAKTGFELELPGQWPQRFDALLEGGR